ncbi:cation:proton antiporter [Streptomyces sp. NPDC059009]|uniref:cation:proton antiporter n=1 Tax=Streptomyces sp. NPDC059009 TaxID=3346694 RepID=UPI00369FBB3F
MELTLIAIVGVVSIVAVAAFSERLGLAAPLSLVVVGIGLSFVPGVPHPDVEPEWILAGVLPPLLYSSAVTMPAIDFRRNFKTISGLAVLLVVVTTLGAGWLFHWLLPEVGWPAAFALGAVVSPTDAVAATSVGKRLGLPSRLLTVLEGEGLVNDASALVLLRSAIAAIAGSVSVWGVAGDFVFSVVVAVAAGLVVGVVNVRVRALLKDTVLNTAISFVIPFVAYVPAEEFDASGVLAVVVAGLVTGHQSPRFLRAQDRLAEATNWRTVAFLLESTVFLLMGLGLKALIDDVHDHGLSAWRALGVGLAAAAFVIVARMVFVAPLVAALRKDERRAAEAKPHLERMQARLDATDSVERNDGRFSERQLKRIRHRVTRVSAHVDFVLKETLGWRGGVVLAWSGMRGAITVAAAQTLPDDTPYRPQLILIAFVVAATTLFLQGLTLPAVIRGVRVPGDDPEVLRADYVGLLTELGDAAAAVLDGVDGVDTDGTGPGAVAPEVVDRVRADSVRGRSRSSEDGTTAGAGEEAQQEVTAEKGTQGKATQEKVAATEEAAAAAEEAARVEATDLQRAQYIQLRLAVLTAERETLLSARSRGTYSSRALTHAQHALDLDEARMEQLLEVSSD